MATEAPEQDAPTSERPASRIRPHQLVIGIGVAVGLFTVGSGIVPLHHRVARRLADPARGLRQHPERAEARLLHGHPGRSSSTAPSLFSPPGPELGAGRARPPGDHAEERQAPRWPTSAPASTCRRCCATPPPGSCTRSSTSASSILLGRHDRSSRSTTSCPRTLKFLHGDVYQGVLARRRRRRPGLPRRRGVGDRPPLRRSGRTASASRPSPSTRVILGTFLALGRHRLRRRGVPHRPRRPARRSRSGRSSATRCRAWSTASDNLAGWHQVWWIAHVVALLRLPRDPAGHDAAPHVHVAAEHVPARHGAAQGRDEADAEPDGDRARELRRLHRRGLHLEAAARHRRLHDVRPLHGGLPGPRHRQAARPPRDRAQDRRGHGRHRARRRCRRRSASIPEITIGADSLFERITPEEVWACTSCKACDEICPVNIEILDKILDMRRYLSLMESNFPTELGNAYRSMENSGQPVGHEPGRPGRLGRRSSTASTIVDGSDAVRPRVPLLGRLRRLVRRQEPEGHPGDGQAAAAGRHRLRHPRPVRELHRRPGPPLGQRVHLPDARHAEHRDAQRHGREEDRHAVPALLQHAAERVPAARRPLRGGAPQPVPRVADRRRASST